jgi:hypothetical protein
MLRDPESHVMEKAYARWAPVYDVLCGPVFVNGRRAAAQVLPSPRLEAQTMALRPAIPRSMRAVKR